MHCAFYAFIKELVSHLFWENWELIAEVSARTFSQDGAIAVPPRPSGALGLPFVLPLACLAVALGPGRPGLRRCRQGGLAFPAGDRFWGGRRPGRPDAWRSWHSAAGISGSQQIPAFPSPRLRARPALSSRLRMLLFGSRDLRLAGWL